MPYVKSGGETEVGSRAGQGTGHSSEGRSKGGSGLREPEADLGLPLVLNVLYHFAGVDQSLWASGFSSCKITVVQGLEYLMAQSLVIFMP